MFSALNQGSLIYILDKTSSPKFKIGEVLGVSQPTINFNQSNVNYNQTYVDLKVRIEGETQDFKSIPSTNSFITYQGGKIVLSETKQGIQQEVESMLQNSKQIVDNIEIYKQNIIDCEEILKDLNPQFAKDRERDERLSSLETKFSGVENKLDKILTLVTNKV